MANLFIFSPQDSYENKDNKGYGFRGGQDIMIMKLKKKSKKGKPACVPGPGMQDSHTISHTENQIPIIKTYSRASVQARKHFFINSPARWGANTFT